MVMIGANLGERAVTPEALVGKAEGTPQWLLTLLRLNFNGRRRAEFYRFLASYLQRGYRLDDALTAIYLQDTDDDTRAPRSIIATAIPQFLHATKMDGRSFAAALQGWAPAGELMALHAFEESGLNADTLRYLAHTIRMTDRTAKEIRKVFTKAFYTFVGVQVFAWAMAHYIVPQIYKAIPQRAVTTNITLFRDVFDVITAIGPYVFGVSLVIPIALYYLLPRWVGPGRERVDQWPIFQTYREWQGSLWLRSLAALVAARMTIAAAIAAMDGKGTPYLNYFGGAIKENLSGSLPDAMRKTGTEWPSPGMITALGVFLSGENPEESLQQYADEWLENNQERVEESLGTLKMIGYIVGTIAGTWFYLSVNEILSSFTKM